jgi:broad specificity phosphatase PhoE
MSTAQSQHHTIYLVRHGETVDNIRSVYAGITDSALTNHGVEQGLRLGRHFAKQDVVFTHFYASDLSRARKTAENIRGGQATGEDAPEIVLDPNLREQDFGFYELKPFYARSADSGKTGKETHREEHKDDEGFQDIETKESMAKRADSFLDQHLMPVLQEAPSDHEYTILIVSHGILLSSLWKAILRRQKPHTVTLAAELEKPIALEHLGGFSNTGYLHLYLTKTGTGRPAGSTDAVVTQSPKKDEAKVAEGEDAVKSVVATESDEVSHWPSFSIHVRAINGKEHLKGLKRTGGGVGSSKSDASQSSLETFFKKRKTDK